MSEAERATRTFVLLRSARWIAAGLTTPALVAVPLGRGMSLNAIASLAALGVATSLLLDAPLGALADRVGARRTFVLSCLTSALGFIAYGTAHEVPRLAIANALLAIGRASNNGVLDAWFANAVQDSELRQRGFTQAARGQGLTIAIGSILGLLLVSLNTISDVLFYVAAAALAALATSAIALVSEGLSVNTRKLSIVLLFRQGITAVVENRLVRKVVLSELLLAFALANQERGIVPLVMSGSPEKSQKLLLLAYAGAFSLVFLGATRKATTTSLHLPVASVGMWLTAALNVPILQVFLFAVSLALIVAREPVATGLLQNNFSDQTRTTSISAANTLVRLGAIVSGLTLGLQTKYGSSKSVLIVAGVATACASQIYRTTQSTQN